MKRIVSALLIFLLLPMPTAQAVGTSASSAVLMDADSGRVLYAQIGRASCRERVSNCV